MSISIYNHQSFIERRRELRINQTKEEKLIWNQIRGRKINDHKFIRQYNIGPYILDFYCSKLRLAIEIDGFQHLDAEAVIYDKDREKFLAKHNIEVVRFWNNEVLQNLEGTLKRIEDVIRSREALSPSLVIREGSHEVRG